MKQLKKLMVTLIAMLGISAIWAEGTSVATIGDTTYETLQAAITAAADGQTVTLQSDTAVTATISVSEDITLDLNGSMVSSASKTPISIASGAKVTIQDSSSGAAGGISCTANKTPAVAVVGSLTLKSGNLSGFVAIDLGKGSTLTMEGGNATGSYMGICVGWGPGYEASAVIKGGSVYGANYGIDVEGGTAELTGTAVVSSPTYGVRVCSTTTFTMNGGTIVASQASADKSVVGVYAWGGAVILNGGTISVEKTTGTEAYPYGVMVYTPNASAPASVVIDGAIVDVKASGGVKKAFGAWINTKDATVTADVTINSGSVSVSGAASENGCITRKNTKVNADIKVSGGTFSQAIADVFCADGYMVKDNGDGTFTAKTYAAAVSKADGTVAKYDTVEAAVDAANTAATASAPVSVDAAPSATETSDVSEVINAVAEKKNDNLSLTVPVSTGTVTFNNAAVQTITDQAGEASKVSVVVDQVSEEAEKPAAAPETAVVYNIEVKADTENVFTSEEATDVALATVALPVPETMNCAKVYYYDDEGNKTDMNAAVADNVATFTTSHFSTYTIEDAALWDGSSVDTAWYDETKSAFEITTAAQLAGLAQLVNSGTTFANKTLTLGNNINLNNHPWAGIGVYNGSDNSKSFQGTFNGNGATLKGVTFTNGKYRGFFNQIYNAAVSNLTVEVKGFEGNATDKFGGAAIAGYAWSSTIENCVANGELNVTHNVAGIAVRIREAKVIGCTNNATLSTSYTKAGGIVALSQNNANTSAGSFIQNCTNNGNITSSDTTIYDGTVQNPNAGGVGGILGCSCYSDISNDNNGPVTITGCVNTGVLTATNKGSANTPVGQIAGQIWTANSTISGNKGLTTTVAEDHYYGMVDGLSFATVEGNVATYVNNANLKAGETYLVTGKDVTPSITLAAGESITFDSTLAKIDATGITAATAITETTDGDNVTYQAAFLTIEDFKADLLATKVEGADGKITYNFDGEGKTYKWDSTTCVPTITWAVSGNAQYYLLNENTWNSTEGDVTISNVNFVFENNETFKNAQLYFMNKGNFTVTGCTFNKVILSNFYGEGDSSVTGCTFTDCAGTYAIKDIRGANINVANNKFENCSGGVMVSAVSNDFEIKSVKVDGNTFVNVSNDGANRGIVQLASSGVYADDAVAYTGNTATDSGDTFRQLNTSAVEQVQVMVEANKVTLTTDSAKPTNWLQVADVSWYDDAAMTFTLTTAKQLAGVAKLVNEGTTFEGKTITLEENAEIDFAAYTWSGIGVYSKAENPNSFMGVFNGNGATFKNVTFADNGSDANEYRGFFNQIYKATVQNLTIECNDFVEGAAGSVGGAIVVGHVWSSTIDNCVAKGKISGTHNVGGIAVRASADEDREIVISNCKNLATIENNYSKLGGILSLTQNLKAPCCITNCVNEGSITSTARGENGVGGILGWNGYADTFASAANKNLIITGCENKVAITATETAKVGQIIGSAESYLEIGEGNKGLTTQLGVGDNSNYLNFATVEDGVATYKASTVSLEAGKTYLVTAPNAKTGIVLDYCETISFDTSLAIIDETAITSVSDEAEIVRVQEGSTLTFSIPHTHSETGLCLCGGVVINETNFPDKIFRTWVLTEVPYEKATEKMDTNSDGVLSRKELAQITKISPANTVNEGSTSSTSMLFGDVESFAGLEYFTSLTTLQVFGNNKIKDIDLTKNTALESVDLVMFFAVENVNVSGMPNLTTINVMGVQGSVVPLKSLNTTGSTALTSVMVMGTELETLDLSSNVALTSVSLYNNQITDLILPEKDGIKCSASQTGTIKADVNGVVDLSKYDNYTVTSGAEMDDNGVVTATADKIVLALNTNQDEYKVTVTLTVEATEAAAEVNGVKYATLQEAIDAANEGDTVLVTAAEIELPKITKAGLIFKSEVGTKVTNKIDSTNSDFGWKIAGTTFDGFEFTQSFGLIAKDITIKNCQFTGKSGLYYACASGTWTIDNCVFNPTWAYGISVGDGSGTINISNSVISSWNSFSAGYIVNFYNCIFKKGASTYSVLRTYNKMTITDSTFEESYTDVDTCGFDTGDTAEGVIEFKDVTFDSGDVFDYVDEAAGTYVIDPTKDEDGKYTGGTFATEPSTDILASGYIPTANEDGTYGAKVGSYVAEVNGTKYETLQAAIKAANAGETVKLLDDVGLSVSLGITKAITIDLNGFDIHMTKGGVRLQVQNGGSLEVTGKGTIVEDVPYFGPIVVKGKEETTEADVSIIIGKDVTLKGWAGLFVDAPSKSAPTYTNYDMDIVINGKLEGLNDGTYDGYGLYVNGSAGNADAHPTIKINGTAVLESTGLGVYAAGYSDITVEDGAQITGDYTGIEIRAGKLTVNGGTITGNGIPTSVEENLNGTTSDGVGIAVSQHSTKHPIDVKVNGGTINGYTAFVECDPSDYETGNISIAITGGAFNAINGGTVAVSNDKLAGFVSGSATANVPFTENVCAEGYIPAENDDGTFGVIDTRIFVDAANGDDTAADGTEAKPYKTFAKAMEAVQEGGMIILMSDITGSTRLSITKPVTVKGAGDGITSKPGVIFAAVIDGEVKFENITFGSKPLTVEAFPDTYSYEALDLVVENCVFTGNSIYIINNKSMKSITINNCSFDANGLTTYQKQYMVWLYYAKTITITNNKFDGNGVVRAPIHLGDGHEDGTTAIIKNNVITGFERCVQVALANNAQNSITIEGNTFTDINLAENTTAGENEYGIVYIHEKHQPVNATVAVTGNTVTDCGDRIVYSENTAAKEDLNVTVMGTVDVEGEPVSGMEDIIVAYIEPVCATIDGQEKMTLSAALAYAKANAGTVITLDEGATIDFSGWASFDMEGATFTLNGNGATITGLKQSLFSSIGWGNAVVEISNLTISNPAVTAGHEDGIGALVAKVAENAEIIIKNCHVIGGSVTSTTYAAGLVGYSGGSMDITLDGCSVKNVSISGGNSSGALIGHANGGVTVKATTVGGNTINNTNKNIKSGVLIGTLNGTNGSYFNVIEESATTTLYNGEAVDAKLIGRLYTKATYNGGEYFTDPTTSCNILTDDNGTGSVTINDIVEVKDEKYFVILLDMDQFKKDLLASKTDDGNYVFDGQGKTYKWMLPNVVNNGDANAPTRYNSRNAQYFLLEDNEAASVTIKNVNFVFTPPEGTVTGTVVDSNTEVNAAQLYFRNTGDFVVENCTFKKVLLTNYFGQDDTSVTGCTFTDCTDGYAIKDLRGKTITVANNKFENCSGGVMVSAVSEDFEIESVTIDGNAFNNVSSDEKNRGLVQLAASGVYVDNAVSYTDNTATESCGDTFRQLNESAYDQVQVMENVTQTADSVKPVKIVGTDNKNKGYYATLAEALTTATEGQTVTLLADVSYETNGTGLWNITKSIILDGNGHVMSGWGSRGGNKTTLAINQGGTEAVSVTIKNLTINNDGALGRPIETRGNITSLTLENCVINATGTGNTQCLTIGGSQESHAEINLVNTTISAGNSGYPIISFNPMNLNITGGKLSGYCGVFLKGRSGSFGSKGSVVTVIGTEYDCPNVHSAGSNDFGVFALQDDDITLNLTDVKINATAEGGANQAVIDLNNEGDRMETFKAHFAGSNTSITGDLIDNTWGIEIAGLLSKDADVILDAPEGYKWDDEGVLVAINYVAEVADAKYESLQDAINAATEGQTVKVLKDVKLETTLTIAADKNITLDLKGDCNIAGGIVVPEGGTATINISEESTGVLRGNIPANVTVTGSVLKMNDMQLGAITDGKMLLEVAGTIRLASLVNETVKLSYRTSASGEAKSLTATEKGTVGSDGAVKMTFEIPEFEKVLYFKVEIHRTQQ